MRRFCENCGGRLKRETTNGGLSRDVCPNCSPDTPGVFCGP